MDDLLSALERSVAPPWRALAAVAGVGLLVGGVLVGTTLSAEDACASADDRVRELWNESRRLAMHEGLRAAAPEIADPTFQTVAGHVDVYAATWSALSRKVCESGNEAQQRCLDARLDELDQFIDAVASADAAMARHAVTTANGLTDVGSCWVADTVAVVEDPAAQALRRRLDRAALRVRAQRASEALPELEAVIEEARTEGHAAVLVDALVVLSRAQHGAGDDGAATATAREALRLAEAAGTEIPRVDAMLALSRALAHLEGSTAEALGYAERAIALLERVDPRSARHSDALRLLAFEFLKADRDEEAIALVDQALEIDTERAGPRSVVVASNRRTRAAALRALGRYEEALAELERVSEIKSELLGENHPDIAILNNEIGTVVMDLGDYKRALKHQAQAVRLYETIYGPDHIRVAHLLMNQAGALYHADRIPAARANMERILAIIEAQDPPPQAFLREALSNLANIVAEDDSEAAIPIYRRALALKEAQLGGDNSSVAITLQGLSASLTDVGELDEALALAERALEIKEATSAEGSYGRIRALSAVAEVHTARKDDERAAARWTEVLELAESTLGPRERQALSARVALGKIAHRRGDTERALELLETALARIDQKDTPPSVRGRRAVRPRRGPARHGPRPRSSAQARSGRAAGSPQRSHSGPTGRGRPRTRVAAAMKAAPVIDSPGGRDAGRPGLPWSPTSSRGGAATRCPRARRGA